MDTGFGRLDVILSNLNASGSGQRSKVAGRIPKTKKTFKPNRYWARKKWACKNMGGNSGFRTDGVEVTSALERPMAVDKSTEREVVPKDHSGSMVVIGCLESPWRHLMMSSSSKQVLGDQGMVVEDHDALGLSSSVSEGKRGMSFVKESEDTMCLERSQDGLVSEWRRGLSGEIARGLGLSVEMPSLSFSTGKKGKEVTRSLSGLGCTGVMESGPTSKPKRVQAFQSKDAKPKMKPVTSLREGISPTEEIEGPSDDPASGQNREGISPELVQIETMATYRSGSVEKAHDAKPKMKWVMSLVEGISSSEGAAGPSDDQASGQNGEGITSELAQIEMLELYRAGSVG